MIKLKLSYIILLFSLIMFSCSDEEDIKVHVLTDYERVVLEDFSKKLTTSITDFNYEFLRGAWDENLFKKKIQNLNQTQSIVLDYWFNELNMSLNFNTHLVDVSNNIRYEGWRFINVSNQIENDHLIIKYTFAYFNALVFIHYKVELENNKPRITDIKNVKHNKWGSEIVENLIKLNSKYPPRSKRVRDFLMLKVQSQNSLKDGDTLAALMYLYEVPSELNKALFLSDRKLEISSYLNDSIFYSVLYTEQQETGEFYYDYLEVYHTSDSLKMKDILPKLKKQTGVNEAYLDSLSTFKYFWVN